jgi:hypothetical protein
MFSFGRSLRLSIRTLVISLDAVYEWDGKATCCSFGRSRVGPTVYPRECSSATGWLSLSVHVRYEYDFVSCFQLGVQKRRHREGQGGKGKRKEAIEIRCVSDVHLNGILTKVRNR